MYSREIAGQEYTFGVSGKLIMNVLVMYDRQTGSLWSQLLGKAVEGELKGTELEFVPSIITTWEDWHTRYPETVALKKGFSRGDPYQGYYQSAAAGVIGETIRDERLYVKEFIIGVAHEDRAVAFPFGVLNETPVVNYDLGGLPILVVFNTETGTGVVFDRQVGEQTLTFQSAETGILLDDQTGTRWEAFTGVALEGELTGMQLARVKSTSSFWFGWKDWFPDTEVYSLDR